MKNKFIRQLIEIEIKLGFLSVPAHGVELMPTQKTRIKVLIDGIEKDCSYNPEYRRIFGLTAWYKKNKAKPKDEVELIKATDGRIELRFLDSVQQNEKTAQTEDNKLLDLSGLSSQAKGDIVENRTKELILLHSQGLLSAYKPVTDTEGIDLIVVKNGQFHPLFLQVKGRYTLHEGRSLILSVKVKTFTPHSNYYVIGAYFNPNTLEIDQNILLIPSIDVAQNAITVKAKNGEWYRIVASLNQKYAGKWARYLIKKDELATKLIEKFEDMHKYIK